MNHQTVKMTRRDVFLIIAVAAILILGWLNFQEAVPGAQEGRQIPAATQPPAITAAAAPNLNGFYIGSIYVAVVDYNGSTFSPTTVFIPRGGAVVFRNRSNASMRVASNPHPTHNSYPEKGGCVGSLFDSCVDIPPKVSWSFAFKYPGTWGYHNVLNDVQGGFVVVQ